MKETYILVFVLSFPTMLLQILDLLSVVAFFVALIDSLLADFATTFKACRVVFPVIFKTKFRVSILAYIAPCVTASPKDRGWPPRSGLCPLGVKLSPRGEDPLFVPLLKQSIVHPWVGVNVPPIHQS
jgi:hypothetical protein